MGKLTTAVLIVACAVFAVQTAAAERPPRLAPEVIAAAVQKLGIQPQATDNGYFAAAASMAPTLHCGLGGVGCSAGTPDRLIARPYGQHQPRRGDIVGVRAPRLAVTKCGSGGTYLTRIIALPGETWQERRGYVYIDGKKLNEPYVMEARRDFRTLPLRKIASGHYFFMGDNRAASCDSREWGTVTEAAIEARAIAIYWPASRARLL